MLLKINNEIFSVGLVDEKTNLISSLVNDKLHVLKEEIDFEIYKRKIKQ